MWTTAIRHGVILGRGAVTEGVEEDAERSDEQFYGITIRREAIQHLVVDALHGYGYALVIDPGEGCETVDLTLSTYRADGASLWLGSGFTKSQYARDLRQAHGTVVAIVDLLAEMGLLRRADDNSGYYRHRDWEKAKRRIAAELAFTGLDSRLAGGLVRGFAGPEAKIETVVDNAGSAFDRLRDLGVSLQEIAEGFRQASEQAEEEIGGNPG